MTVRRLPSLLPLCSTLLLAGCTEETLSPKATSEPPPVVDESGRVPDLSCPGMPGCESTAGELFVGAAARPITPALEA
jgi:hypothetical protein